MVNVKDMPAESAAISFIPAPVIAHLPNARSMERLPVKLLTGHSVGKPAVCSISRGIKDRSSDWSVRREPRRKMRSASLWMGR